ncbi:MAG: hypothetical protein WA005_17845 [Candidatus Binataceae bacterium]
MDIARREKGIAAFGWYEVVARPAPGSFGLKQSIRLALGLILALIAANVLGHSAMNGAQRTLAIAIVVLSALPTWLWLSGVDRGHPFMMFMGILYAVYYAIPLFFMEDFTVGVYDVPITASHITAALWLALGGLLCMLAGYYGPQKWLIAAMVPKFGLRWSNPGALKFTAILFAVVGLAFFVLTQSVNVPKALAQITFFTSDLVLIGSCILFGLQLMGSLDLGSKLLLWGVIVPVRALLGFGGGAAAAGFLPVLILLIFYCSITHSAPWKTLLIGFLAVLIVRPLMVPLRMATWGGQAEGESIDTKGIMFARAGSEMLATGETPYEYMIQFTLRRLASTMVLTEVMRDTPDHVPYWNGATFVPILFKPIPRLIWPDKPQEISGETFGHRYGLLDRNDYYTSYNLPQVPELYINFGVVGVLIGMFVYGMLYRASLSLFVHPGMGFGAVVAAAYVSVLWTDIESAAGLAFGALFWGIIFIGLIHLVVEFGELTSAGPALEYGLERNA